MMKQIGIAIDTISVDGQWRRKAYSTITDNSRPIAPASARASSELVTALPESQATSMSIPRRAGSSPSNATSLVTARDRSTRFAERSL
ncbi:hypothetical protein D3C71_2054530 [compost metagenome]